MTGSVEIADDPDHPEGGHALIVFRTARLVSGSVTLLIESLTEGFDYRGPRRLDVVARPTDRGVEVKILPDVVSALKEGLAVNLALMGSDIESDVLWPALTPPRAAPRRRAMQTGPRRVVADAGLKRPALEKSIPNGGQGRSSGFAGEGISQDTSNQRSDHSDAIGPKKNGQPPGEGVGLLKAGPDFRNAQSNEDDATKQKTSVATLDPPDRHVWRLPAVAGVALAAFMSGAALSGLLWFMEAPAPQVVTAEAAALLPSPYDMLNDLADHAPDGSVVDAHNVPYFRMRGETAASAQDVSFWRKWATKGLLKSKSNDAAAVLSDFATDLATTQVDKPDFAAARFVWEMAAVANDCAAMENIAAALETKGINRRSEDVETWRKRAANCRSQTLPGR